MSRDSRVEREKKTVRTMIEMYCSGNHRQDGSICPSCSELLAYALARIDACPFRRTKPTCAKCPVHCYSPSARESVRAVMRFSGPRMLWRHPCLAVAHAIDGTRAPRK